MSAFEPKHVADAIKRIPATATKDLKRLLEVARVRNLDDYVTACEDELAARPIEFTADAAKRFEEMAREVAGLELVDAIRYAFTQGLQPSPGEVEFLRWLAANPGGSFTSAVEARGKGDVGLLIGHLVYDRYGCFRKFLQPGQVQSDVLLQRTRTSGGVCYHLKPEAEAVFRELNII